jgi:hypothetical protein
MVGAVHIVAQEGMAHMLCMHPAQPPTQDTKCQCDAIACDMMNPWVAGDVVSIQTIESVNRALLAAPRTLHQGQRLGFLLTQAPDGCSNPLPP